MFIINVASFLIFNAYWKLYKKEEQNFEQVALCPTAILDEGQWYRFITSEVTHGSIGHILMNMSMFLVWGTQLEK